MYATRELRNRIIALVAQGLDDFAVAAHAGTVVNVVLDVAPRVRRRPSLQLARLRLDGRPLNWVAEDEAALRVA